MQGTKTPTFPKQHQDQQPGVERVMHPQPQYDNPRYKAAGKLEGKRAIITGGDSGIGRAVALVYAKEGADVAILYLNEHQDAALVVRDIEALGKRCVAIAADLKSEEAANRAADDAIAQLGGVDILVNNAGVQYPQNSILDITKDQMMHTFESNYFSYFFMTRAILPHLHAGAAIINTASITAFEGNERLIDYASTKGAIVAFTRSMALSLMNQEIRVNAVSPGPVWTPLIVSSFSAQEVGTFGSTSPMHRAAQPCELAPIYVYLACEDATNVSGQVFHVNSGTIIN
ncbi:MAG: SDR family oxidoreductase [Christensenellales bacterium]|jgi:NAD(P)-dependent dehydrogenase (short-subunit alcohol dehydrogenase family)